MVVDERSRHEATTLIEHLPPVGWADVATKHDLLALEHRIDLRFDGVDEQIKAATSDLRAVFEHELRSQTTTVVFGMVTIVLTMAALAFALVRFS